MRIVVLCMHMRRMDLRRMDRIASGRQVMPTTHAPRTGEPTGVLVSMSCNCKFHRSALQEHEE